MIFFWLPTVAQNYTVANAHAHNDYAHPVPFHTAFDAGFGSIEADVYPVNATLVVAHDKEDIQAQNTLTVLYLEPLLREMEKDSTRKIKLLIDIKEDYKQALQLLVNELAPLKKFLFTYEDPTNPVLILISGTRPVPGEYHSYPDYIFFDDDLRLPYTPAQWKRVRLVSLSFKRYSSWKGERPLPAKDNKILQKVVDSVHNAGKEIRFWAAPDNATSWLLQMKLGVDLIGTDQISELAAFLQKSSSEMPGQRQRASF